MRSYRGVFILLFCLGALAGGVLTMAAERVRVEGTVTFAGRASGQTVIEISAGERRIKAELPSHPHIPLALLLRSQVRLEGEGERALTADRHAALAVLRVRREEDLSIMQLAPASWAAAPLCTLDRIGEAGNGQVVRVAGVVSAQVAPREIRLRQGSSELAVRLAGEFGRKMGERVEALGVLSVAGKFEAAGWRSLSDGIGAEELPTLLTTAEVHALRPEDARAAFPVRISGVVTSRDENGGMVQDVTRGVYVFGLKTGAEGAEVQAGDFVEIEGSTAPGTFAPMIHAATVRRLGRGVLPEPVQPTWERLNNGSLDCQYIELHGFVTEAYDSSLVLLMAEGRFGVALVPGPGVEPRSYELRRFEGQNVRIRGTVFATRNNDTGRVLAGSIGMGNPLIGIAEPVVTIDKSIGELLQFDARAAGLHRVRVKGQVLHARDRDYYLSDGSAGVRFVTREGSAATAGDLVEVVGFPRVAGSSPVLLEATIRKLGRTNLPPGAMVSAENLSAAAHLGALVAIKSRLLGVRSNATEVMLDLQAGSRSLIGRLDRSKGELAALPAGSVVRLQGVYAGQGKDPVTGAEKDSAELLLNSPEDIRILERPSWWTPARAVTVISSLIGVLMLGAAWVVALRGQVEARTRELRDEIEERKRMEEEVARVHQKLVDASRRAGMAQIATGVLHNVGNVLNSVNVSANILSENARHSRIQSLTQLAALIEEHSGDLPEFFGEDPRGRRVPRLLRNLECHFRKERALQLQELEELKKHVEHIKETVAMQQNYARSSSTVYELASLTEIVEDAVRLQAAAFVRHEITVTRKYAQLTPFYLDRHKVLQILVNLLTNARDACDQKGAGSKQVVVRINPPRLGHVTVEVEDTGAGIAPENLQKIFSYGFTTRVKGHGYGLHSSANAAAEMRSTLSAQSEGVGKGATFTLTIPCLQSAEPPRDSDELKDEERILAHS